MNYSMNAEPIAKSVNHIALIEERALLRDYMVRAFETSCDDVFHAVADISSFLKEQENTSSSLILLSRTGKNAEDETMDMLRHLKEAAPHIPVVILSDSECAQDIVNFLQAGASGYIPTSLPLQIAIEAIRFVKAGGVFVPANSLSSPGGAKTAGGGNGPCADNGMFTERQMAVIDGLRRGKQNKIIAYELNVSESTIKVHVRNIMKKLKARNRTEAAFMINKMFDNKSL